jgi:PAS domain S-box-containing protein
MEVAELRRLTDVPVIAADQGGFVTWLNGPFTEAYGWTLDDLVGKPLPTIIPRRFHDAHHTGFARFLTTKTPSLLGQPLDLVIVTRDQGEVLAEHFIVASESDGQWEFAAIIRRRA